MPRRPSVSIVGCGRTGGAIGLALARNDYRIAAAWSHSRAGRRRATELLEVPVLADAAEVARAGRVVIVAVPDDEIARTAQTIAPGVRKGQRVVHTSGSVSVEALAPLREAGAQVGSLHPLQTLPDARRGADALEGAAVAVTCEDRDRRYLSRIASGWGGRPFPLPDDARVRYHTAAVFASNYIAAVLWAAAELLEEAGVANASALLGPLARTTVDNVTAEGAQRMITGPVARGDLEAVRRHVDALRERTEPGAILDSYRALARLVAELAGKDPDEVEEAAG